jgi:glycosyltransferase involved in cell wall biosynthesis
MGVPVIASRIGGIPESVADNETGLMFEPRNAEELAQKIRQAIEHPESSSAMAARAGDFVRAHCAAHHDRIMAAYTAAIAEAAA